MALYATLVLLKGRIKITATDRDDALTQALTAASRSVDAYSGREPDGFTLDESATARTFDVHGRVVCMRNGRHKLLIDELGATAGLVVEVGDGTTWTAVTDYRTGPENALARSWPIDALTSPSGWGSDQVRVTAQWGWPSVPDQVVEATLLQAQRLYGRKESPQGVAGAGEFGAIRLSRVDPDVRELLAPFTLPGIA